METVYKVGKAFVLVTAVLPTAWILQAFYILAMLTWRLSKKLLLVVSYVLLLIPTWLFRRGQKKRQRHEETLAAIRGQDQDEEDTTPLLGSLWLLDTTKQAIDEAKQALEDARAA